MISLYSDGQKRVFSTDATTVGDVLKRNGVTLAKGDLVEPAANSAIPVGFFNINVYRARPVMVVDGEKTYHIESAYQSPRLLAEAAGVSVYPEDGYSTEVITDFVSNLAIGDKVTVDRATPILLYADGKIQTIRTQSKTVGAALTAAKIPLGLSDTLSVPATTPITAQMSVTITRVSEAVATITQVLPRTVKTVTDPTVLKGQTSVQTAGADGQKVATYTIHYRDGVETGRDLIKLISQTDPVTEVVVVGTKVVFAGSVEYWRPMVETAAAQYGLDPNMMMRIMSCESGGNATSVSHFIVNGEHPTGLFQFLPSTWASAGGTPNNILDGAVQIQLAAKKMAVEGTGAWQCK